jgi:hypothetical protein
MKNKNKDEDGDRQSTVLRPAMVKRKRSQEPECLLTYFVGDFYFFIFFGVEKYYEIAST